MMFFTKVVSFLSFTTVLTNSIKENLVSFFGFMLCFYSDWTNILSAVSLLKQHIRAQIVKRSGTCKVL